MQEIDPLVVVAGITAMGGLLLFIVRLFLTGAIMPRTVVPREDYERQVALVESYAARWGEQTAAVNVLTKMVERIVTKRAAPKVQ